MKNILIALGVGILLLSTIAASYPHPVRAADPGIAWDCTLHVNESGGKSDSVVFGEASDARDGPLADIYDVVKPPAPSTPYLRAIFTSNLSSPYESLWKEYRRSPSSSEIWNVSIQWVPSDGAPTTVTITWDPIEFNTSEYASVALFTNAGMFLKDMRTSTSYTVPCPANTPQGFKIICFANHPPYLPSNPQPANRATGVSVNTGLGWTGGDPDSGAIVTYDVYFGTTMSPARIVTQQSNAFFTPAALVYQTTYYWKIISWDTFGASTTSSLWSFTTGSSGGTPGGTNGSTSEENKHPVANASASEQRGFVSTFLIFNGSLSVDPDGYLTQWFWDFGDGTNGSGEKTTHLYHHSGTYTVTLTVTDNKNATDTDTVHVLIIATNNPPTHPVIHGIPSGTKNKAYTFTVLSTDPENDFLQYLITWGDGTQNTSNFLPNGTLYSLSHSWGSPGKYMITATATDNTTLSEPATFPVFIDVYFVGTLGFLFDRNNDGLNDSFYTNVTSLVTSTQTLANGSYLLDTNGDGKWDYRYNPRIGSLTMMGNSETAVADQWVFVCIIVLAIAAIAGIVYLYKKKYF